MTPSFLQLPRRQQGAATMIVVAVLAIAMALVALTISNTGLMEQRITGNDLRAREAQEAAEAGLDYGLAWTRKHTIASSVVCSPGSLPTGCPTALTTITGSSTGENYRYNLVFTKTANALKISSTASGVSDATITATSDIFAKQIPKGLFDSGATMPPPWVVNGCVAKITGNPNMFLLKANSKAMVTSLAGIKLDTIAGAALLNPQQLLAAALKLCLDVDVLGLHLGVNVWADANVDGILDDKSAELGTAITLDQSKNTDSFKCETGDTHCAWNEFFKMDIDTTVNVAVDANQVFNSSIPCGPTLSAQVYVINNSGPINAADISGNCTEKNIAGVDDKTIGAPKQPILLIVPKAAGCPKFNGGITIYGIVYYESQDACKNNGWGGATVYGSVMWEGDVDKPNANSRFIETDYAGNGNLNDTFNIGVDDAVRLPGTWKDF